MVLRSSPLQTFPLYFSLVTPTSLHCPSILFSQHIICGNASSNFLFCPQESGVRQPGRQADRVGQPHHEQGARDTAALLVGHDVRVRALRLVRRVRRARQHLLHL